jgi:hypothetical protein
MATLPYNAPNHYTKLISLPQMQFDQTQFLDDDETLKIETLLLDGNRGVYIPQIFLGIDDEYYWQAWESILDNATLKEDSNKFLSQDDDLWLVSINS